MVYAKWVTTLRSPDGSSRRHASGSSGPRPARLSTHPTGVAEQAVQVHGHRQLGPDPADLWQPAALQGPAGQLGEGVGGAPPAAAGVVGVGGAGQGLQGRQQGVAGLGLQESVDGDHAFPGRGQPHPRR